MAKTKPCKKCISCGLYKPLTKFRCYEGLVKNGRGNECRICEHINFKQYIIKKYGKEYWDKCEFDNFKDRIRTRTRSAFRRIKQEKPTKTEKLLGCDWVTAKKHIESYFNKKINWNNFHEWHIDHIVPLAHAKNTNELIPLCHYTNLQPLIAKDNLAKGSKII
jgi:hypothetical protein